MIPIRPMTPIMAIEPRITLFPAIDFENSIPQTEFESVTSALGKPRSIQLSYWGGLDLCFMHIAKIIAIELNHVHSLRTESSIRLKRQLATHPFQPATTDPATRRIPSKPLRKGELWDNRRRA